MKIKAVIEKGSDNLFSIYSDNMIGDMGLGGFGKTVQEAKADFEDVIQEALDECAKQHDGVLPKKYQQISVTYYYDLMAFFNNFDWINISKFAHAAGINESKMRQYKTGASFAGETVMGKIQSTIHRLGQELSSASLL